MNTLFVAWRDPIERTWFPVGRLTAFDHRYRFDYTRGVYRAQQEGTFRPFPSFPDVTVSYEAAKLFPFFTNRLISKSRPEYRRFVEWIDLGHQTEDPIALLGRSGGERQTDTLQLFPQPERAENGSYHIHFFVHGLSHMTRSAIKRANTLRRGELLLIVKDVQNPEGPNALLLRTPDKIPNDVHLIGFLPRYLASDISPDLQNESDAQVRIVRVNQPPAPVQFRILCCLTLSWKLGADLFQGDAYQPVNESTADAARGP